MHRISFFIAAYNCAETITESIDSIMETNFENGDELIIVNDFSTDNTAELLKIAQQKYPEIVVINHKRNKGGAGARNTAVENSKHELLFCLDSDNLIIPLSITPLKKYLIDNKADVASFQYQHFFYTDKLKAEYIWSLPEGQFDAKGYYKGENTPGQHGNYLFTKQSWITAGGYAEGSGALDTWTFGLRQAITGAVMVILKDTYYYHRLNHSTSYWMQNAETHLWSVSVKATYALFPFYDRIDETFLSYMQGKGKYTWYYNLKNKPMKLVDKGAKDAFYTSLQKKISDFVYPKATLMKRGVNKITRNLGSKK